MSTPASLKFLGTGGARFVVARQLRASGGTVITAGDVQVVLDPGPGTLVRCAKARPPIDVTALDAVVLTHAHIDHSCDVNVLVDALTDGGLRRRGLLFAPRECLEGENAVVLRYLRSFLEDVVVLEPETGYRVGDLEFRTSLPHRHGVDREVETYGAKFRLAGRTVSFMVDTAWFEGLAAGYAGSDVLVMNVVRHVASSNPGVRHLSSEDAERLLAEIRPSRAILTHFGMTMLKAKPWVVAEQMSGRLGLPVRAATDGMTLEIGPPSSAAAVAVSGVRDDAGALSGGAEGDPATLGGRL